MNVKMKRVSRRLALNLIGGFASFSIMPSISFATEDKVLKRIDEITNGKGANEVDIFFDLPEIAENGNQVKLNFEIDSIMTKDDYIKQFEKDTRCI